MFSRSRGKSAGDSADDQAQPGRRVRGRADEQSEADGAVREFGPYDLASAPRDDIERLDLGALRIPAIAGVEIQLQAGPDGQIQQVVCGHGESRLQLGVFAAPRTEGIWDEIRSTLRTTMAQAGGTQQDATGDYGPELRARLRDGGETLDVRHVGVDGPRWFVHGVYLGRAAVDPQQAGPLADVLRGLVVDRGTEARPVGEALPLRLPPEAAAQLAQAQAEQAEPGSAPGADPGERRPAARSNGRRT